MTKSLNCRPAFALALTMSVALWMFPETAISSAGNKKSQGKLQFLGISFNAPKKANGIGRFTMTMQKRFHLPLPEANERQVSEVAIRRWRGWRLRLDR